MKVQLEAIKKQKKDVQKMQRTQAKSLRAKKDAAKWLCKLNMVEKELDEISHF